MNKNLQDNSGQSQFTYIIQCQLVHSLLDVNTFLGILITNDIRPISVYALHDLKFDYLVQLPPSNKTDNFKRLVV